MGTMDWQVDHRRAQRWLDEARAEAERSWAQGGLPIGAVLVDPAGEIISRGHNQRVQSGDPTAHAEIDAIRNAGRRRDWRDLTLVTTLSPCPMCTGAAVLFGIQRIIIGERTTFQGAEHWLQDVGAQLLHMNDPQCIELMLKAQRERPDLWAEDIGQ